MKADDVLKPYHNVWDFDECPTPPKLKYAEKHYTPNGVMCRNDGPAYLSNTEILWIDRNGEKNNPNGPAKISFPVTGKNGDRYRNGYSINYFLDNKLHNEKGPAIIRFDNNGKLEVKCWRKHGFSYRNDGGPTKIQYGENSRVESWQDSNKNYHREGGKPAIITYAFDKIIQEEWRISDSLHRLDGPAYIEYNYDGSIYTCEWWVLKGKDSINFGRSTFIDNPPEDYLKYVKSTGKS